MVEGRYILNSIVDGRWCMIEKDDMRVFHTLFELDTDTPYIRWKMDSEAIVEQQGCALLKRSIIRGV